MSDDEAQPQANFTGFEAGPQQRLARVAAVGGGSATDKHRENRQHAQTLQASSQVKGSGIVDSSNSSGAGFGTEAADLGAFGAHGRKPVKQRTGGAPPPSVLPSSQPAQSSAGVGASSNVVQLNPREAEEMERRMRADLDRATQKQQQQEDVFEAEYAAIQANQQTAAPAQGQGAVTQVADDDFDF